MKEEIKNLCEAFKNPGATSGESEGSETQQRGMKTITNIGLFIMVVLLSIGTQQAVINLTAERVAAVCQLEERTSKAQAAISAAAEKKAAILTEIAAANSRLNSLLQAVDDASIKLASIKDAMVEVPAAVPVSNSVALSAKMTEMSDALVAKMKGWLK
jgi:hypothetical protein